MIHCDDVHAKCVIGDDLASFGSANLNLHSVLSRTELGLLVDDLAQLRELKEWFDGIWRATTSPRIENADAFVAMLDAGEDDLSRPNPCRVAPSLEFATT
jgi:phosphatidylserine/phosphatidylglycerophosphate/cardiolipin synthase-like enzyme